MGDQFKATVTFDKRTVFVSQAPNGRGSLVGPRLRKRIKAAQPKMIEVLEPTPGETRVQFMQRVEEAADVVVLVDDELSEALMNAPQVGGLADVREGQELVVVLRRNQDTSKAAASPARVWLAFVDALGLEALSAIAQGRWDLSDAQLRRHLHWLYDPTERVTHEKPEQGLLSDADDVRLGERVKRFRDHQLDTCTSCVP